MQFAIIIKYYNIYAHSGECADEVFGGYPWFRRRDMIDADTFPWALSPNQRLTWLSPAITAMLRPLQYVAERYHEALQEVPRLSGEEPEAARMREIFYLSLTRWMPTLLDRKDRMSMAFGLEVRVPFCDHRLVEYVWNVPWAMKNYQNREKGLLRQALSGVLPEPVLWRAKSPYPKTHNPAYWQAVRKALLARLADPASHLHEVINVEEVRRLATLDPAASGTPWFGQLMGTAQLFAYLLQLDTWLTQYNVQIV